MDKRTVSKHSSSSDKWMLASANSDNGGEQSKLIVL